MRIIENTIYYAVYLTTTAMPYPVLITRTNRNTVLAVLVIFPLYIYIYIYIDPYSRIKSKPF